MKHFANSCKRMGWLIFLYKKKKWR